MSFFLKASVFQRRFFHVGTVQAPGAAQIGAFGQTQSQLVKALLELAPCKERRQKEFSRPNDDSTRERPAQFHAVVNWEGATGYMGRGGLCLSCRFGVYTVLLLRLQWGGRQVPARPQSEITMNRC